MGASLDAIPRITKRMKTVAGIGAAMYFTYRTLQYEFFKDAKDDLLIPIKQTKSIISFHALLASISSTIAIFMWKQGINAYRQEDRAISISHHPKIKWVSSQADDVANIGMTITRRSTRKLGRSNDGMSPVPRYMTSPEPE